MTRQQYIKRLVTLFAGVLEILIIFAIFVVDYTTRHRMGMQRHILYLNGKWEKAYPVNLFKWLSLMVLGIYIIIIVSRYFKRDSKSKIGLMILTVTINLITISFILFSNTAKNRAYYIISMSLFLISILQNIIYKLNRSKE